MASMASMTSASAGVCGCDAREAREGLTIGELARLTGIAAKTIRYYEEIGLLPRAERAENRYRRYGQADVNRLVLLRRIRLLGAPLATAKPLLDGMPAARCADVRRELLALVDEGLAALDREIGELFALRGEVRRYQHALGACPLAEGDRRAACTDRFAACTDVS